MAAAVLKFLCERGEIDETCEAPVEICSRLSKRDKLCIAMVENVQREKLAPVAEAMNRSVPAGKA